MIRALIAKDFKLFFRNQFFAVITLLGIVVFALVYYLMPAEPDDTLYTALYLPAAVDAGTHAFLADTLEADLVDSEDELLEDVTNGDYSAGVILTEENITAIMTAEQVDVPVYVAPGTTPEMEKAIRDIFTVGLNNINWASTEKRININDRVIVLGADLLGIGEPLALRDRMLPLLLMMIFSIELMGLANLISEEVNRGTARALLVTPLRQFQFFGAKVVMGISLAFAEVLILLAATGKILVSPFILIAVLLVGSLMVTGVAFFVAAFAAGFMSVMSWSMLFLLLLLIPGIGIMFPTMASSWVKAIPSFYLVDSLHRILNYGAGWGDILSNLTILFIYGAGFLAVGGFLVRRRF